MPCPTDLPDELRDLADPDPAECDPDWEPPADFWDAPPPAMPADDPEPDDEFPW